MNGDIAMSPREALNLTVDAREESMIQQEQPLTNGFYNMNLNRDPYSASYLSSISSQALALDLSSKRLSSGSVDMSSAEQQIPLMDGKSALPLTTGTIAFSDSKGAHPNAKGGVLLYNLDTRNVHLVSRSPKSNNNGRNWNVETKQEQAMYSTINLQDQRDCYIGSSETYLAPNEQVAEQSVEQQMEMNGNQACSDPIQEEASGNMTNGQFSSTDEYGQTNNDDHHYTGNCSDKSWIPNGANTSDYYPQQRAYIVYGQHPTADLQYTDYPNLLCADSQACIGEIHAQIPNGYDQAVSAGGYDASCPYMGGHDFYLKETATQDTGQHYPGFDIGSDVRYANGHSEEQYAGECYGYGAVEHYANVSTVDTDEQYAMVSSVNVPTEEHYADGVKMETDQNGELDPNYSFGEVYYCYDSAKIDESRAAIPNATESQLVQREQFAGSVQIDSQDKSFSNRNPSQENGELYSNENKVYTTLNSYAWDSSDADLNTYENDNQQSDDGYKTAAYVNSGHLDGMQVFETDANNYPAASGRKNGCSRSADFQENSNDTDFETSVNIGVLDKKRRARSAMVDTARDKKSY